MSVKINKVLKNPAYLFILLSYIGFFKNMDDAEYLKKVYKIRMGHSLDLENPKTFNEKLQWLKLYDRRPEYTTMVDKYAVKKYVADRIGEQYIIPTLGVWDRFEEIDFDKLPDKFVLKCTHDSGGLLICKDKSKLNIAAAKKKINNCLRNNFYYKGREWIYKNVEPRIIAEKYMEDNKTKELRDYKFMCFNGQVEALWVICDRSKQCETKLDYFDSDFKHMDIVQGYPNADNLPEKPLCFKEMCQIASKLSKGIPHLRVDLYEVNGQIYFGELTFASWSGFMPFQPPEWDKYFGDKIKII